MVDVDLAELRPLPLFEGLTDEQLGQLVAAGDVVATAPGDELFTEGLPAERWWVLVEGAIALSRRTGQREEVLARQGRTKYNTVAISAAGEVVAYSDLATTVHDPGRAYQWGTLVRRDHRGHRLGVALKVANLRLLQHERPDVLRLTTYNAEVNSHMIGVNEALGFVWDETVEEREATLAQVRAALAGA